MIQEVEMTYEEKVVMYMATDKQNLAEMLIESNRIVDLLSKGLKPIFLPIGTPPIGACNPNVSITVSG